MIATLFGSIPISKTYYSDHIHIKYMPRYILCGEKTQIEDYLEDVEHVRNDMYARELYNRNYKRFRLLGSKPICTVVGEKIYGINNEEIEK